MKIKDYIYIKKYTEADKVSNNLLVIGFLRKYYRFKFFYYINIPDKPEGLKDTWTWDQ